MSNSNSQLIKRIKIGCNLCGGKEFKKLYEIKKINIYTEKGKISSKVINGVCLNCGFVFQNPKLSLHLIKDFYSHQFRGSIQNTSFQNLEERIAQSKFIMKNMGINHGKVLDIGSFNGYFLSLFKKRGWQVLGIEPSKTSASYAQNVNSVPTIAKNFEDAKVDDDCFDLVTINHTLEHVFDPSLTLKLINKKLKKGGYLFVEVPNIFNPRIETFADFFSFQHLSNFSPTTMGMFLKKAGFKITHKKTNLKYHAMRFLAKKVFDLSTNGFLPFPIHSENTAVINFFEDYKRRKADFFKKIESKITHAINLSKKGHGLVIFGAGEHSSQLLERTNIRNAKIIGFVDSDNKKHGKRMHGIKVFAPYELSRLRPSVVLISSYDSQHEMKIQTLNLLRDKTEIVTLYKKIVAYDTLET